MAAVIDIPTHATGAHGVRLRPAPATVSAQEYRRRRLVALCMGLLVLAGSFWIVRSFVDAAVQAPAPVAGATTRVVVQPGDTVTSIAARFADGGRQGELVDQIIALNGGAALAVGQALVVPVG